MGPTKAGPHTGTCFLVSSALPHAAQVDCILTSNPRKMQPPERPASPSRRHTFRASPRFGSLKPRRDRKRVAPIPLPFDQVMARFNAGQFRDCVEPLEVLFFA